MIAAACVDLWLLPLATTCRTEDMALLDADEQARAGRFVFERDRRRFINAHVGLRRVLAGYLGAEPGALRFEIATGGKPELAGATGAGLGWNLSHSADVALLGVAAFPLGVDIECLRKIADADGLAAHHFTPAERDALAERPAHDRDRAFLAGWTRKEACLKAVGAGLRIAPRSFECGIEAGWREVPMRWAGRAQRLMVGAVDCGRADLVAAVALPAGAAFSSTAPALRLLNPSGPE